MRKFFGKDDRNTDLADVNEALEQYKMAKAYFNSVTDPMLIDYAIHEAEAARLRYIYLFRQAGMAAGASEAGEETYIDPKGI